MILRLNIELHSGVVETQREVASMKLARLEMRAKLILRCLKCY